MEKKKTIYNELVRDKAPDILRINKKRYFAHRASDKEFWQKLKEKLEKEVKKFSKSESAEDLVNIAELVHTIIELRFGYKKIQKIHDNIIEKKGGLTKRLILECVFD